MPPTRSAPSSPARPRELERSRVTQMFERMLRCCDELGKTLQPRLVLDCALIDVATVEPLVPLGDLIERLGDLEARLAGGGGRSARPRRWWRRRRSAARGGPRPPRPGARVRRQRRLASVGRDRHDRGPDGPGQPGGRDGGAHGGGPTPRRRRPRRRHRGGGPDREPGARVGSRPAALRSQRAGLDAAVRAGARGGRRGVGQRPRMTSARRAIAIPSTAAEALAAWNAVLEELEDAQEVLAARSVRATRAC